MVPFGLILILTSADLRGRVVLPDVGPSRTGAFTAWDGYIELPSSSGRVRRHHASSGVAPDTLWMRRMRDTAGRNVVPNWIGTLHEAGAKTGADEPSFHEQWALSNTGQMFDGMAGRPGADVGAIDAWTRTSGDSAVVVAFLDGGIDLRHPDFRSKLAYNVAERAGLPGKDDDRNGYIDDTLGWDFVVDDPVARDLGGHGTSTASLVVAAWDGNGMAGLAPGVRVLPIRVADGGSRVELADLIDGMDYAVKRGAKIINLSLGGLQGPTGIDSAIARAVRSGAMVVVSAGNEALDLDKTPSYPASLSMRGLVVVGASTMNDSLSGYSNRSRKTVSLCAPGDAIFAATLPVADTIWTESFESGLDGWTTGGNGTVNWGTESKLGTTWLSDSPGRNYAGTARSWIRSPRLNPDHRSRMVLSLKLRGVLNVADALLVESAPDTSFTTGVDTLFRYGSFSQMEPMELAMDARQDGQDLYLRFTLVSAKPSSMSDSGVMIDDLVLRARDVPQPPAGTYARVWGTSFSAPLVTGALALLASKHPSAPLDTLIAAVVGGSKQVAALSTGSRSGTRLWIPGAFARLESTTPVRTPAPQLRGLVSVRGGVRVLESGNWTFEWRTVQGTLVSRLEGKGEQFVARGPGNGTLVWRLRASDRSFTGMVLPQP